MALVKILVTNLFAGANLQKLEVGHTYEIDDNIAVKWIDTGKAEASKDKKGEKLVFEVATPATMTFPEKSELQAELDDANAKMLAMTDAAKAKETELIEALAAEKKRADDAEKALAEADKKAKKDGDNAE
ncbi:hypothetical protein PSI23_19265 [Xenorhabdus sp. XENO-10]|uniref:Phage protein n=1 Tax=Xenorhabdus yunnanensis TaxID=3025878 RepID=A0ABT5LJS6_9GAMM|nr:hypothetical protein [Xenorhabdus yunnanensis]MDC9591368.1 hypothetical protein [Xenorhabdus yunnanensis]